MSIKLDLHIHSKSRGRVFINAEQLRGSLKRNKLDGVAITNFFDISHALWLKEKVKEYIIIVGQEIWTKDGHIVALGIKKRIADFQTIQETTNCIHEQGGIAVAVHPFLSLGIGKKAMLFPSIDAVEVYNGVMGNFVIPNYLAERMAKKMGISQLASTDTTDPKLIGRSYTEIMTKDPKLILKSICSGDVRLFKRALPFPFIFVFKGIFKFQDVEPCSTHGVPCFVCAKSMTVRLFKEKFKCFDCGKIVFSHIACSNGHYICVPCMIKRGTDIKDTYSIEENIHAA